MPKRILFVDDEAPIREILSLYFRKKGMEVTPAVTVREARELVAKECFDLAILDVNLAGENGLELVSVLKQKDRSFPVIIFTGLDSDPDVLKRAMAEGADAFMGKGESLHTLFAEVCRHLPKDPVP